MALRPCLDCGRLTTRSRCRNCQPRTTGRGYGSQHQAIRAQWEPTVNAGRASCHADVCLRTERAIAPGEPWDLGHTPDRSGWTGPEHLQCNRGEPSRRRKVGG